MDSESCIGDEASKQLHGELRKISDTPCAGITDRPTRQTVLLEISPAYVKDWKSTDAFRELYQNWKDAILETFQLDRRDFKLSFQDDHDHFAIIGSSAPKGHAEPHARGFIKYEKKTGQVMLVNACARLPIECLVMGHTTRDRDNRLCGSHGDGLKLAALAMNRQQFQMSIAASHCHWKFGLHGPQQSLRCVITAARKISRTDWPAAADDMANLRFRIERDVAVVIGAGRSNQSRPVSPKTFLRWLRVTLDIHGLVSPTSVVQTPQGDLLLDPKHSGQLFLHRVRLAMHPVGGKVFMYGYNFACGKFSRDREGLISQVDLADLVRQIWEYALSLREKDLFPSYVNLLRNHPHLGDVDQAERLLEPSTKTRIWEHLLRASRKKLSFHSVDISLQTVNAIRACTGKKPTPLPETFWQLLRSVTPVRTIEEEQQQRCKDAVIPALPDTAFAKTINWAFRACLTVLNVPRGMQVLYVEDMAGKLDVFYHAADQTLRVPHQWWKLDRVDHGASCHNVVPTTIDSQYAPVSWRDVVEELLTLSIPSLFAASPMSRIMRQIRRLLKWFPSNIQISLHAGGLLVTWEDNAAETIQSLDEEGPEYNVILHVEHCRADAELLRSETSKSVPPVMCDQIELSSEASTETTFAACGCCQEIVPRTLRWCVFAELDHPTAYYAMICLNERSAIYGLPSDKLSIPGPSMHDGLVLCDPAVLRSVGIRHEESVVVPTSSVPTHTSGMSYHEWCKRLKVSRT
ncbi:hypothetical protein N7466_001525 [Penicillium verhagenii]|uniref:uncharacterized protein n=1 Tax=Penicillium verhagenii TaxID=1562060 RepID=UPI0025455985|nr:uncharacterized protein N7466_001525 [Penicillium verhagenii]KAJ5938391.1 hypothetical protein N7466_001525 [Penicillium verhagenii]